MLSTTKVGELLFKSPFRQPMGQLHLSPTSSFTSWLTKTGSQMVQYQWVQHPEVDSTCAIFSLWGSGGGDEVGKRDTIIYLKI
jgi:hypothetical protein